MEDKNFENGAELSVTDHLAIGRNKLANERTLLAYIRTFLSFTVAGVSLIQFFNFKLFIILGYIFIPCGLIILVTGFVRFTAVKSKLNSINSVDSTLTA